MPKKAPASTSTRKAKPASGTARPFVVVRTYSAGVHVGEVVRRNDFEIELANARRLWRWRGANTLHEVALHGVSEDHTRLSEPVASIILTEATEIIATTDKARANLTRSRWDLS